MVKNEANPTHSKTATLKTAINSVSIGHIRKPAPKLIMICGKSNNIVREESQIAS